MSNGASYAVVNDVFYGVFNDGCYGVFNAASNGVFNGAFVFNGVLSSINNALFHLYVLCCALVPIVRGKGTTYIRVGSST